MANAKVVSSINWRELKREYLKWRELLYQRTKQVLTSSERVELAEHNELGYYHHVPAEHFEEMIQDWRREGRVPEKWIAKGRHPGIWTAMFDPHNTYSIAKVPVFVVRFFFKRGFFLYDPMNPNHRKLWKDWAPRGKNPWKELKNESGESMEERLRRLNCPSHKDFYERHGFGAFIGYSDYISPVILLGDSVDRVEFMRL